MSEHTPWCCDGYAAFCPLCPRPTELIRCPGHAYSDRNRETVRVSRLHAQRAHPDFEYRTTEGARKQFDASIPPADENGDPDPTWETNVDAGRDGWERFDYTEEAYWRRPKRKTGGPCTRPECGGAHHTDPWGTPVQCPHAEITQTAQEQPMKPRASVVEIIASGSQPTEDGGGSIVVPREVRINGVSVYTPKGTVVKIDDFALGESLVTVNLTLVVRRLVIGADSDPTEEQP